MWEPSWLVQNLLSFTLPYRYQERDFINMLLNRLVPKRAIIDMLHSMEVLRGGSYIHASYHRGANEGPS